MKNPHSAVLVLLATLLALGGFGVAQKPLAQKPVAQQPKPSFSIVISGSKEVKVGSEIVLNILVKNLADHKIVFGRYGPLTNEKNFFYNVHDSAGNVPADTPYMHGGGSQFGKLLFMPLEQGGELELDVDLSRMFVFSPGIYTVQLSRHENDFAVHGPPVNVSPPGETPKFVSEYEPSPKSNLEVKSNTITFAVTP